MDRMNDKNDTLATASFGLLLKSGALDEAIDVLEKAGPRAGHKYTRRWRNAKGEWEYEYATPLEKQHAQMAFTFAAQHGTETQQERALDVLKRVEPDKWQDHVHAANAAAHAAAARPLPAHDPLPHQPVVTVTPEVARFAHGDPKPEVAAARREAKARADMVAAGFPVRANPDDKTLDGVADRASSLRSYSSSFYNDSIRMGVVNDEPRVAAKFSADDHQRQAALLRVIADDFFELNARAMQARMPERGIAMNARQYAKLAQQHMAAADAIKAGKPIVLTTPAPAPAPTPPAPAEEPFTTKSVDGFREFRAFNDGSGADATAFVPTPGALYGDPNSGNVRVSFVLDSTGKVRTSHGTLPYMDRFRRIAFDGVLKNLAAKFEAALDPAWRAKHAALYGYTPATPTPLVVAPIDTAKPYVPSAEEDAAFKEADRQRTAGAGTEPGADNFDTMPDTPSKPKKKSKARHGVEVQAAWEEAGSPKLEGDDRAAALARMGSYLHEIQDFRAGQDDTGMSGADMAVWRHAKTPARMAQILRKYRRQLTDGHGDLYFRAGLHEPEPIPKGHIPATAAWTPRGGLVLKVDGYLGPQKFDAWRNLQRQFGWEYDRTTKGVGMPASKARDLDIPAFIEAADKIGVFMDIPEKTPEVLAAHAAAKKADDAIPERPADVPADRPVTSEQTARAIAAIRARRASDTIALTIRDDGQYAFYAADFREKTEAGSFWHTMSSRNGVISGLMDVDDTDWSVNTYSPELAMEALGKLKDANPKFHFYVDPRVEKAVADAAVAKAEAQKPIPEVEELLADGFQLKPYQNEMVRFLDKADGNAIVGDEMGLGKTLQSLAWVAKNNKKAIVVVPKVVRRTWIEEAHKFFPGHFDAKELRSKDLLEKKGKGTDPASISDPAAFLAAAKTPLDLTGKNLVTINYESLEKFMPYLEAAGFDTIIVDESHRAKNPKAKTTKAIQRIAAKMKHRILMSGTAVKNGKEELFTQLEMVKPGIWRSPDELKRSTHGKAWSKMRHVYLARSKKNVLKDLPEKQTTISKLYAPGAPDIGEAREPKPPPPGATERQKAAYEKARAAWEENKEAEFDDLAFEDEIDGEYAAGKRDRKKERSTSIGEFSRVRGQLALAKADATVDMVKEILDSSDSKVLVFTESIAAAKDIAAKLGDEAILHYGQQSDDKREAAKREFQREGSPKRVFVSTRPSLAVGATLTAADKVVFNDLPWTAADVRQAEDRAHRVGQKNAVNVYWNVAEDNNFDENVAAILRRKYDLSAKINEGRQMSPEEKEWMEKPVTLAEVMDRIKGKPVGPPEPVEKSARAILRDMSRALVKAAR